MFIYKLKIYTDASAAEATNRSLVGPSATVHQQMGGGDDLMINENECKMNDDFQMNVGSK